MPSSRRKRGKCVLNSTLIVFVEYSFSHVPLPYNKCHVSLKGCSQIIEIGISDINVNYDMQSSDHFPLSICIDINIVPMLDMQGSDSQSTLNWGKASDSERSAYTDNCSELLGNIQLPREAVCCSLASCDDFSHIHSIASLYSDIVNGLHCAASGVIPITKCNCMSDERNTPGWNEYVKDAHSEARDAFKLWVQSSKPRLDRVTCFSL